MKLGKTSSTIAMLGLLAYAWLALGLASQLVYCVGADGHSGIELAHASAPCATPHRESAAPDLGSDYCTDIPLLGQLSKQEKPGDPPRFSYASLTTRTPGSPDRHPASAPTNFAGHACQFAASLKTTILRA